AFVDGLDPEHRDLGYAAGLVKGASRRAVDQTLVGHVLEQALEVDLLLPRQAERAGDLALAGRLIGRRDEVEDLLAAGQSGGALAGHQKVTNAAFAACFVSLLRPRSRERCAYSTRAKCELRERQCGEAPNFMNLPLVQASARRTEISPQLAVLAPPAVDGRVDHALVARRLAGNAGADSGERLAALLRYG